MKFLTAALAFALALALSGTALAMPDMSPPPQTTASGQQVILSAPDQRTTSTAKPLLTGPTSGRDRPPTSNPNPSPRRPPRSPLKRRTAGSAHS